MLNNKIESEQPFVAEVAFAVIGRCAAVNFLVGANSANMSKCLPHGRLIKHEVVQTSNAVRVVLASSNFL